MLLYHASNIANIRVLKPNVSNHNRPLVYFSSKKENVSVYLSNAVEKYCKETGFKCDGKYYKWASYGFDSDGILRLEEYYPHAIEDTYLGVCGYIYSVDTNDVEQQSDIPFAYVSRNNVKAVSCEYIYDAYAYITELASIGKIRIKKFDENNLRLQSWINNTITEEYKSASSSSYKHFLRAKFDFLKKL